MATVRILILLLIYGFFSGCATSPQFDDYPQEISQRSEVLPEGVSRWRWLVGQALDNEPNFMTYPLYWEQGFSETVTLVWLPLPFEVKVRLLKANRNTVFTHFAFLGSFYSREKDFTFRPSLRTAIEHRLTGDSALKGELLIQPEFKRTAGSQAMNLGLKGGAEHDFSDKFGSGVYLWALLEVGPTQARYLGALPPSVTGPNVDDWRVRAPIDFLLSYKPWKQWEFELRGSLHWLGYNDGYFGFPAYLSVIHTW